MYYYLFKINGGKMQAIKKNTKTIRITLVASMSAIALIIVMLFSSCGLFQDLTKFVNVFAGNATVGHTSPCATTPFGMIKVGPESGNYD